MDATGAHIREQTAHNIAAVDEPRDADKCSAGQAYIEDNPKNVLPQRRIRSDWFLFPITKARLLNATRPNIGMQTTPSLLGVTWEYLTPKNDGHPWDVLHGQTDVAKPRVVVGKSLWTVLLQHASMLARTNRRRLQGLPHVHVHMCYATLREGPLRPSVPGIA
jgi:hypothetical protein